MKQILIAEDEKSLALAYKTILEKHGYKVRVAYDGEEALQIINSEAVDLVLLDINMPGLSGFQFLTSGGNHAQSMISSLSTAAAGGQSGFLTDSGS